MAPLMLDDTDDPAGRRLAASLRLIPVPGSGPVSFHSSPNFSLPRRHAKTLATSR
jgi:hypothetical protein